MRETLFEVKNMDCSCEESLVRMKLQDLSFVQHLEFDLAQRQLKVFHTDSLDLIEKALNELNLGSKKISTKDASKTSFEQNKSQKNLLLAVLGINFAFFVIEILTGLISHSMGLVADSLDMLADSFVYILSLLAVGKALSYKQKIAKIAGYFQMSLAFIGFLEVLRRFFTPDELPDFGVMIVVSIFALIANALCIFILQKSKSKNEAHMKASMIFTSNDVIINGGVILAGVLVYAFGSNLPDLLIGAIVFVLVVRGAFRILKLS